jgi:hypothetical protein
VRLLETFRKAAGHRDEQCSAMPNCRPSPGHISTTQFNLELPLEDSAQLSMKGSIEAELRNPFF